MARGDLDLDRDLDLDLDLDLELELEYELDGERDGERTGERPRGGRVHDGGAHLAPPASSCSGLVSHASACQPVASETTFHR